MPGHRSFATPFVSVYPDYVAKVERKGRTRHEVDEAIGWLTGYDAAGLAAALEEQLDFEAFFDRAPVMNPHAALITVSVCGVRVETAPCGDPVQGLHARTVAGPPSRRRRRGRLRVR